MNANTDALAGECILLLEDDRFDSVYLAAALEGAGARLLGPHACEALAMAAWPAETPPTAAVISANPHDGFCAVLAARLEQEAVPYLFVSARAATQLPSEWRHCAVISKPYASYQVVEAIAALIAERADAAIGARTAVAV